MTDPAFDDPSFLDELKDHILENAENAGVKKRKLDDKTNVFAEAKIPRPTKSDETYSFVPDELDEMEEEIDFDLVQEESYPQSFQEKPFVKTLPSDHVTKFPSLNPNDEYIQSTNFDGDKWYILIEKEYDPENTLKSSKISIKKPFKFVSKSQSSQPTSMESDESQDFDRVEDKLWVDKYAPKTFMDLVTSDKANRQIMKWIKTWDTDKKILLLVGNAGIGKTSLANVIATQAGYIPISINASDDRGTSTLQDKIQSITQNQNVFGNKKPTLLILDEVDGIAGNDVNSAIKSLLKLTLTRPVICICNDQYAPPLRPLRLAAQIFVFYKSDINLSRVENRIKEICKNENIDISNSLITSLVKQSEGDIRSCLNTLQFSNKKKGKITSLIIQKDTKTTYFEVMNSIFGKEMIAVSSDMEDKILEGCFQNYPLQRYTDMDMTKTCKVLEMMTFCDQINKTMHSNQAYSLNFYISWGIAAFHVYCKTMYAPHVEFPKTQGEVFAKKVKNSNIIKSFLSGINPQSRSVVSIQSMSTEVLPHLVPMINPVIKNLADPIQKKRIQHIVQLDKMYGLEYKTSYSNGVQNIHLDPEIDTLMTFGSQNQLLDPILGRELQMMLFKEKNQVETKKHVPLPELKKDAFIPLNYKFNEGHNNGIKRVAKFGEF